MNRKLLGTAAMVFGLFTATASQADTCPKNDLQAKYALGQRQLDMSASAQGLSKMNLQKVGLANLTDVSRNVQTTYAKASPAAQTCMKNQGLFGVDNSLGAYYLRNGDIRNASLSLNKASLYDQKSLLTPQDHASVASNLGRLYFFLGDNTKATNYLNIAKAADNKNPAIDKNLATIRATAAVRTFGLK